MISFDKLSDLEGRLIIDWGRAAISWQQWATNDKHWAGDGDVLNVIQQIIEVADEMVGSGLWSKIRKGFN